MRLFFCVVLSSLVVGSITHAQDVAKLPGLQKSVEVYFDKFAIPHIFAESWTDAYRVLGALHVQNRLPQMEFNRRLGSGTLAEILGPGGLNADKLARQIGLRRSCEELLQSDVVPDAMRAELAAYAEGANAMIAAVVAAGPSPVLEMLGGKIAPWEPVDSLVFLKYMAWDQGGTSDDLWFGRVVEKLGITATEELWPLDRPYEIPIVKKQFDRKAQALRTFSDSPAHVPVKVALADNELSIAWRNVQQTIDGARWLPRLPRMGSNNWAVAGSKTKSGKPILCNDPHLGFKLPSFWYTCHLSVGGKSVVGVTFPGSPLVVIGHNDFAGFGITNMQADAVDYYVETTSADKPDMYKHRGEWKPITRRTETIQVRGGEPVEFVIESTVHGPIVNKEGKVIAMQWTGLGMTTDPVGIWKMNRTSNVEESFAALDLVEAPAINMVYADADGNIGLNPLGKLPVRHRGQGRIPMEGESGENDWKGWIARTDLPLAFNPIEGFVASANARPHPIGYPFYLGWMWDDSYRIRRIDEMLSSAKELTLETMAPIQNDALDGAARVFVPRLVAAVKGKVPTDAFVAGLIQALSEWDFVADRDATATLIWVRWFDHFRQGVWDDEWETRGLEKEGGSWGFNGNNRREPMLEVLEFLVREKPDSIWFDDRRTPERETMRDIALASFHKTVSELREKPGTNLADYAWGKFNILRINSLFNIPDLYRIGGPVVGDDFTVNPGGDGGYVGGGACWRMMVDFADLSTSVGVYPGGQSADPASDNFADMIPLWADGKYVPLHLAGSPAKLPAEAKLKGVKFTP